MGQPSADRVEARLLDAAEALFSERGAGRVSAKDISVAADLEIGDFERRFAQVAEAFDAVQRRFCKRSRDAADAALDPARWQGIGMPRLLLGAAEILVEHFRGTAGLRHAIMEHSITHPEAREPMHRVSAYITVKLRRLLSTRRDEIRHPDPDVAVAFALQAAFGTLNHLLHHQPPGLSIDDERLPTELGRVLVRYLGIPPGDEG